jgi:DNA repair ATPase RecN
MDVQKLNELVSQLEEAHTQAQEHLQKFAQGQEDITQVNEYLKTLNEIEGRFSIEVGSVVRDYYQEIIKIKRNKAITELGYTP